MEDVRIGRASTNIIQSAQVGAGAVVTIAADARRTSLRIAHNGTGNVGVWINSVAAANFIGAATMTAPTLHLDLIRDGLLVTQSIVVRNDTAGVLDVAIISTIFDDPLFERKRP